MGEHLAYWDGLAGDYDRRIAWLERRFLLEGRLWVCERATGRTLEIGCGTGANLDLLPDDVELTAADPSHAMLAQTRARAARSGRSVALQRAGADALPFPDESFDTVLATYVLCCVPDLDAALAEAVRVLRPGGRLLLADHILAARAPVRAAQRLLDRFTVPNQGEHYTRRPSDHLVALPVSVDEQTRRAAGALEQVNARRL